MQLEVDGATRNDGRDGVLVNHLCNRVTQKHNILVKRFNLTLELDAVDLIDRNGNMFASQLVQKRVLQGLAFVIVHDIFSVLRVVKLEDTTRLEGGRRSYKRRIKKRLN